jgi:hypothetical protein
MPTAMIRAEPLSYGNSQPYLGNTNPYPGFQGFGGAEYAWTGLTSGPAASFDTPNATKSSGNQAPDLNRVDTLPSSGPLFTEYPMQIFSVALEVDDFGTVPAAQRWVAESRQSYPINDVPVHGNVVRYPDIRNLGDESFAMQADQTYAGGPNTLPQLGPFVGDVYTAVEVREGAYIYAVGINAAPQADAVSAAAKLVQQMMSDQEAACGSTAAGAPLAK